MPDINDVYFVEQGSMDANLGPAADPSEIFDDFAERMRAAERFDYRVRVTISGAAGEEPSGFEGSVTIGRALDGGLDRFRIDLTGSTPADDAIDVTLGSSGHGYYVVDRARRTVTEFDTRDDSVPFGSLVRYILISSLTLSDVPVAVTGAEAGRVHFVDSVRGEHLYCVFSKQDRLPSLIERVVLGPDGRATIVRALIADVSVNLPISGYSFELDAPDGFRRAYGPSGEHQAVR